MDGGVKRLGMIRMFQMAKLVQDNRLDTFERDESEIHIERDTAPGRRAASPLRAVKAKAQVNRLESISKPDLFKARAVWAWRNGG